MVAFLTSKTCEKKSGSDGLDLSRRGLEQVQKVRNELQEVVSQGRRLAYIATARLQRGDLEGAEEALKEIEDLPGLASCLGGAAKWANMANERGEKN